MPEYKIDILIVDDDEGHVELVRRNFKRAGISNPLIHVTGGVAALDYVFARGPYLSRPTHGHLMLLLDINMPGGMDGVEVLRQIKADPKKKRIPIVMLTTTDDPREVVRCYDLGCSVYIPKPVDPAKFMEAIHRLGLLVSVVSIPPEDEPSGC